nr:tropinone reductase-like 3 isoform X2 [Tanacetum cinerariifolium]
KSSCGPARCFAYRLMCGTKPRRSKTPSMWTYSARRAKTGSMAATPTSARNKPVAMDLGIKGKVALVAAASKGLGRAVAEELAAEGASLVLCARSTDTLQQTAAAIEAAHGVPVLAVVADLSTVAGVASVTEAALGRFGQVDILVTNAGGPPAGTFEQHAPEAWEAATKLL